MKLRLIIKEDETPPALYQRIVEGRANKTASSDIRALALLAVKHDLEVEPLHESYIGSTKVTLQFTLDTTGPLSNRLEQVMQDTGQSKAKALLKLVTAGWFFKTNPNQVKPVAAANQPNAREDTHTPASPHQHPGITTEAATTETRPQNDPLPAGKEENPMATRMMDSVMEAWGG